MTTFETVYETHKNQLFYFILTKVGNKEVANDLTFETFTKFSKAKFNSEKSAVYTWLQNIAKNLVIDYQRKMNTSKMSANSVAMSDIEHYGDSDDDTGFQILAHKTCEADVSIENKELHNKIAIAFRGLNISHRKVAILYLLRGYKYSEISDMTDLPIGTVKNVLFRGKQQLKKSLEVLEVEF